jgi:uncharacterized protein YgbK (DUF1537 family)
VTDKPEKFRCHVWNRKQQARVLGKLSDEGFEKAVNKVRAKVAHRRARKRTESEREATIERLSIEPAAVSEVVYKIIRADLQAARELYRILVAGGDAACHFVRELAAGLENERKTTLVRIQQAEIEEAGAKAKSEVAAAIPADSPTAESAEQPADAIEPDCDGELVWRSSES